MITLKTWIIAECGWATFHAECCALSLGREDVTVFAIAPGVLSLVEWRD